MELAPEPDELWARSRAACSAGGDGHAWAEGTDRTLQQVVPGVGAALKPA